MWTLHRCSLFWLAAYYERTGDRRFIAEIWPHIEAALRWMKEYGDHDGDSFLEYRRQVSDGLLHQGWKDSDDGVFHATGSIAHGSIAVCEVQGYAYAAWQAGAIWRPLWACWQ